MSEETIFADALARSAGDREAFLRTACGGDAAQYSRILALLRGHEKAERVLNAPIAMRPLAAVAAEEKRSEQIGRYTLLEKLGDGGCGVVWRAEQREPVRREVALKVIKSGTDTREVIARFEAERQALALMDHPNIAKVHDGGATETGRPYFVMELVRGVPITRYCDDHGMGLRERLELFIAVCEAVQHAHQKGIIHRDLKPSNILVGDGSEWHGHLPRQARDPELVERVARGSGSGTGVPPVSADHGRDAGRDARATSMGGTPMPQPKVIDFGIAKATQGRLTDHTLHTAVHQFIGTPAYMSPEHVGNVDVDTRTDIYSLGVLLYELLTGETPLDRATLASSTYEEIREKIRTLDPVRPSARVRGQTVGAGSSRDSAGAADRRGMKPLLQVEGSALAAQLRGDLDWIVMRCLEKDRTRRYESAAALAADLKRHLRDEPVTARPPSAGYTLQKLVRRHRVAVASGLAVSTVIILGAIVSTWQAVRATRAEREQIRLRLAESAQRRRAENQELATRRRAYAADMNLAQQALAIDNLGRARELLDRHRPGIAEPDVRGWEWRHLWQLCRGDPATILCQNSANVFFLAASADGQWILVPDQPENDRPGTLWLWHVHSRRGVQIPTDGLFFRATFSPREPLVALALAHNWERGGILRIWNFETREVLSQWTIPGAWIRHLFSADGDTLLGIVHPNGGGAAGGQSAPNLTGGSRQHGLPDDVAPSVRVPTDECELRRWRVSDGAYLGTMAFPVNLAPRRLISSYALSLSPDGRMMACGDVTGVIHLVDIETGRKLWERKAAAESIIATQFSPDGDMLLWSSGNADTVVHLWGTTDGREIRSFAGHRSYAAAFQFWPDGKTFASAGTDQTIRIWETRTGALLRALRGHQRSIYSLVLLPDRQTLVSGAKDGAVHLWNIGAKHPDGAHVVVTDPCVSWAIAPDAKSVLTLHANGVLKRRHGPEFGHVDELLKLRPSGPPERAHFGEDSSQMAVAMADGRVEVWDWAKGALISQIGPAGRTATPVAFLGQGTRLLVFDKNARETGTGLHEWDLTRQRETRMWPEATGLWCAVSPDKRWCIVLDLSGAAKRIDLAGGGVVRAELDVVQPWRIAFAPDGRSIVVASLQNYARLWDAATFAPLTTIGGFMLGVRSAVFSPDGRRLATGSARAETMRLWDVETWEALLTLSSEDASFSGTGFSPDGNLLGSKTDSGLLHLWRAPSWAEIAAAEKEGRWR